MKKVCVVTTTRAEYGLLRWTIEELSRHSGIITQVIVSGTHLSSQHGYSCGQIEKDGISITKKVPYISEDRSPLGIVAECGVCCRNIGEAFIELGPDIVVVLGDRYELLPICSAALILGIPIAHIAGGEVTEGAIDDQVRNAVTMMATVHFPNSADARDAVIRMRNSDKFVFDVGEPGIENYFRLQLQTREELSGSLEIDPLKKWALATLHPETKMSVAENLAMAHNMMESLLFVENLEIVISSSNADLGGEEMNLYFQELAAKNANVHFFYSLGQLRYLSYMKQASLVIGNSSSGVIETPYLGTPTINIGDRQKGRKLSSNLIQTTKDASDIRRALNEALSKDKFAPDYSLGDGKTSIHIVKHLKEYFNETH